MKILITGAGLVGSYAALHMKNNGYTPILFEHKPDFNSLRGVLPDTKVIVGDITNRADLSDVILECKPDAIVHTAALRQRAAQADQERAWQVNVGGTEAIVNIAEKQELPLIHISSDTIYGTALTLDTTISEDVPLNPHSIYAKTKIAAEEIALRYPRTISLRLTSLFGAWQGSTSTVNEIFRTIIKSGLEKKDLKLEALFPEPSEQTYIKDVADAILKSIISKNIEHKVFNIGAGRLINYEEISKTAFEIFGIDVALYQAEDVRLQSHRNYPLDISRAKQELEYNPQWNLREALIDYAKSFKLHSP